MSKTLNLARILLRQAQNCLDLGIAHEAKRRFERLAEFRSLPADVAEETQVRLAELCQDDDEPFKDFELKVDVMTEPNSNGGIYFHTKFQEKGWPKQGFESQVNVSHGDWIKTGSLYGLCNTGVTPAPIPPRWSRSDLVL